VLLKHCFFFLSHRTCLGWSLIVALFYLLSLIVEESENLCIGLEGLKGILSPFDALMVDGAYCFRRGVHISEARQL
jgi:hypothetical protein